MNKALTILIPVYNELFYTKKCLKNLKEALVFYQMGDNFFFDIDIVLIDDGSTDGTSKWVRENHPDIKILKGDGSLFWSAAINMGIEYSMKIKNITHILFWNKDLYIEKHYILLLCEHILTSENRIIASKMLRKSEPNVLFSFGGLYNPKTGEKINIGSGKRDGDKYNKITKVDWCGGMAVAIPCNVFRTIGVCDNKNFPQYDGDSDLFLRAKQASFELFVYPDLKVWNIHENTGRKEKYSIKNYLWYLNDIRSHINLDISYKFLRKHSSGILPLIYFAFHYTTFTFNYFRKMTMSLLSK